MLSIGSVGSVLSIGSVGSVLSIGSVGSVLSIGSLGSCLSVLSFASFASVAAFASAVSVLAVGRYRHLPDAVANHRPRPGTNRATPSSRPAVTGVMLQFFHWYLPDDGTLWVQARDARPRTWPTRGSPTSGCRRPTRATSAATTSGYGVYDMYDLGEFDQKGTVRTKYGTRDEYLAAIRELQSAGLAVYADIVWNHRLGADGSEVVRATPLLDVRPAAAVGPDPRGRGVDPLRLRRTRRVPTTAAPWTPGTSTPSTSTSASRRVGHDLPVRGQVVRPRTSTTSSATTPT